MTGEMFKTFRTVGRVLYVQFSRDDQSVMSSGDGGVHTWDIKSGFMKGQGVGNNDGGSGRDGG